MIRGFHSKFEQDRHAEIGQDMNIPFLGDLSAESAAGQVNKTDAKLVCCYRETPEIP